MEIKIMTPETTPTFKTDQLPQGGEATSPGYFPRWGKQLPQITSPGYFPRGTSPGRGHSFHRSDPQVGEATFTGFAFMC